ncbi:class I SAM-dependent methyltransferase [Methylobacterium sp. D54C]
MMCSVCFGNEFRDTKVLWDELCQEWQISEEERLYVDRQQGTCCTACGANLRSIVLARAILQSNRAVGSLREWVKGPRSLYVRFLELNGAGTLSPILSLLPGHVSGNYPDVDMHALPYADSYFDFVVHSDTLEHVKNPLHALSECRRVLKPGGTLAFTVPTIVGRLSRDRSGLPFSYHGNPSTASPDYAVATEYGADMWTHVIRAGFKDVTIHTLDYPSAIAMSAAR